MFAKNELNQNAERNEKKSLDVKKILNTALNVILTCEIFVLTVGGACAISCKYDETVKEPLLNAGWKLQTIDNNPESGISNVNNYGPDCMLNGNSFDGVGDSIIIDVPQKNGQTIKVFIDGVQQEDKSQTKTEKGTFGLEKTYVSNEIPAEGMEQGFHQIDVWQMEEGKVVNGGSYLTIVENFGAKTRYESVEKNTPQYGCFYRVLGEKGIRRI